MTNDEDGKRDRPRPLQFGLGSLLGVTAAVALLFGVLRWFDVSPRTSGLVLLIAVVSVAAALGLVVAIAAGGDGDGHDD